MMDKSYLDDVKRRATEETTRSFGPLPDHRAGLRRPWLAAVVGLLMVVSFHVTTDFKNFGLLGLAASVLTPAALAWIAYRLFQRRRSAWFQYRRMRMNQLLAADDE